MATQVETKPEGKDTRGVVGESKPAETGSKPGEVKLVDESAKLVEKEEEKKEGLPATVQSESDLTTKDQPEDPATVAWAVNDPAAASQTGTNQDTITHQEETPSEINPPASDEVERGLAEGESCEVKAAEVELHASEVDLSELAAEGLLVTADTDQQTQQTGSPTLAPQLSSGDGEETVEESFPPEMPAEENLRGGGGGEGGEEEGVLMGVSEGRVMCV